MSKSLLGKGALVVGALVSFLALTWLLAADRRFPDASVRRLFFLGIVVASVSVMFLWSTFIGLLSRTRIWSPPWTFLAGAIPFYILAIWIYFFSSLQFRLLGYTNMFLMACFGSATGARARNKAFPQFSDKDSPSADLPPPTLFPK